MTATPLLTLLYSPSTLTGPPVPTPPPQIIHSEPVSSIPRILRYLKDNEQLSYYLKNKRITAEFSNHNEKDLWLSH